MYRIVEGISARVFAVVLLLLLVLIFLPFLTGKYIMIYNDIALDSYNTFYPRYVLIWRYIKEGHFPSWSFLDGLGGDVISETMFFPPMYFIIALGPEGLIKAYPFYAIVLLWITGISFYGYLSFWNLSNLSKAIGSLMFVFNGF